MARNGQGSPSFRPKGTRDHGRSACAGGGARHRRSRHNWSVAWVLALTLALGPPRSWGGVDRQPRPLGGRRTHGDRHPRPGAGARGDPPKRAAGNARADLRLRLHQSAFGAGQRGRTPAADGLHPLRGFAILSVTATILGGPLLAVAAVGLCVNLISMRLLAGGASESLKVQGGLLRRPVRHVRVAWRHYCVDHPRMAD